MKNKYLIGFWLIFSILGPCQEKKQEGAENKFHPIENKVKFNLEIGDMLEKELKCGKFSYDNPYKYSTKDLEVTVAELNKILTDNGYIKVSFENFNKRIKQIFNRIIDSKSSSQFLSVNLIDPCSTALTFIPNDAEKNGIYVIKNSNFISELYLLPAILDYKKIYPDIAEKENAENKTYNDTNGNEVNKYFWKDDANLKLQRKKNI